MHSAKAVELSSPHPDSLPGGEGDNPRPLRRLFRTSLALLIALAMACVSYRLFTLNNDFPLAYHPDEWSKVDQIASRTQVRNMNHPLLMLEAANLLRQYWNVSLDDDRALAIVGRCASALLASIGVFGFAMAGFARYRFVGLLIVGSTAMLCPSLLVYAHYMKEDAALVGGIGVAVLGAALTLTANRWWTQLLACVVLAIGTAAAASGKYVGAATVAPALLTLCIARVPRWWVVPLRLALFALITTATFVAINARGFEDPWTLTVRPYAANSFEEELIHGTTEHSGIRLVTPGLFCLRVAIENWQWHLWAFVLIAIGASIFALFRKQNSERDLQRNPITRWGFSIGAFAITYIIVLSFNAIPFARYALPITVLGYIVAACAVSGSITHFASRPRVAIALTTLALMPIIALQTHRCLQYDRQFADDSRERLSQWIAKNVPAGTRIVADSFAELNRTGDIWRFPNRSRMRAIVSSRGHASNSGPLRQLAASGVKYVVAAEPNYQRFFAPGVVAGEGNEQGLEFDRSFYRSLFARGTLVWSSKPSPPSGAYVDPEIRVYDITVFKNDPPDPNERNRSWLDRFWR